MGLLDLITTARRQFGDHGPTLGFSALLLVGVVFFPSFPPMGVVLFPSFPPVGVVLFPSPVH